MQDLFRDQDISSMWSLFKCRLLSVRDKHVKTKKLKNQKSRPMWMTQRIDKLIRKRNKSWTKFSNSPSYLLKNKYNQLKREVSKEIKSAKVTFEERLADEIKTEPKAFYSYVRGKSKSKVKVGPLI